MRICQLKFTMLVVAAAWAATDSAAKAGDNQRLVVHEWGTFTSLQDEHGQKSPASTPTTSRCPVRPQSQPVPAQPAGAFEPALALSPERRAAVSSRRSRCGWKRRSSISIRPPTRSSRSC